MPTRMAREAQAALSRARSAADCASTAPSSRRTPSRSTALGRLEREVFGPVLHVVRFDADRLDAVLDAIDAHRLRPDPRHPQPHRRDGRSHIRGRLRVGNIYVNRNMIGAVVGVQPFGGEGLSGTGPKAGGPHYLPRFATERTLTIDTTAAGGNASLLSLQEEGT